MMHDGIDADDNVLSRSIESRPPIQNPYRKNMYLAEFVGDSESDGLQGVRNASGKTESIHSSALVVPGA